MCGPLPASSYRPQPPSASRSPWPAVPTPVQTRAVLNADEAIDDIWRASGCGVRPSPAVTTLSATPRTVCVHHVHHPKPSADPTSPPLLLPARCAALHPPWHPPEPSSAARPPSPAPRRHWQRGWLPAMIVWMCTKMLPHHPITGRFLAIYN